jgi:hypothetical protein
MKRPLNAMPLMGDATQGVSQVVRTIRGLRA